MRDTVKTQSIDLRDVEYKIQNKNVTTLWLLMLTQLFFCFMYGFFIRINSVSITTSVQFVHTALLLLLVIGGFGLALASSYKMVWTSLGFNLLIAAIAIQMFFLVNAFWVKAAVYWGGSYFTIDTYTIALVPGQTGSPVAGANMNQAIKCALSCIVAYTFIAGRTGLLQLYLMTTTGSVVYQLARQTCLNNFPYEIGSIKIFLYGGVLGLISSIVIARVGRQANIIQHYNLRQNRSTILLNIIGIVVVWALFPLLTRDAYINQIVATQQVRVFSLVLALSSAALLSIFMGYFRYGFWMVIYSVIGAGVSVLSSTAYISNPVYGILFGIFATIIQFFFLLIHQKTSDRFGQIDPHAYVFVGQGIIGILFQAINRKAALNPIQLLTFNWGSTSKVSEYVLGNGAITIGMALLLGFAIGAIMSCCVYHQEVDNYTDYTYWINGDGLNKHHHHDVVNVDDQKQHQDYSTTKKDVYI